SWGCIGVRVSHDFCTGALSHCCCLHRHHSLFAMCHFQVFPLHTAGNVHGWLADYRASHSAAAQGPLILPWAPVPYPPLCCCQVQSLLMGPCTVLPLLLSDHRLTALPCATFRSPHNAGGFPFF
ncbi:unnamed protein product, partial [Staurois parvus]